MVNAEKRTLMAYELDEPFAALISSSARHSAMDLTLRKADSRVYTDKEKVSKQGEAYAIARTPVVRRAIDWFTRRSGDTSTAWRRTVPCEPIRVESSRGPVLTIASTKTYNPNRHSIIAPLIARTEPTWMGFWSLRRWMISKAWATMRTAKSFFPLLRPFIIRLFIE
jgi:hypothetical protein